MTHEKGKKLGINGLGRIGKLTLWNHVSKKYFSDIVVNIGREAGNSLKDIEHYIARDSTYGSLPLYLYGCKSDDVISDLNEEKSSMIINGINVHILRQSRNPKDLDWKSHGIDLVVDTTGQFLDPTVPADDPKGSIRGHLEAGAKKVIASAPFKIKDKSRSMPDDAVTIVKGINDHDYAPSRHTIISGASCTTTCLAHMMKPLLDKLGTKRILTASMATIHAATGSQQVLDRMAKPGATDLRKDRSILNNIILTTTGAAQTLALVLPDMKQIGFMAESVRVPITTGSLIILTINIQEDESKASINRHVINNILKEAADIPGSFLRYTDEQNVSCDIIAMPKAAAIIEGHETHTRTAEVTLDVERLGGLNKDQINGLKENDVSIPLTQAVIYGWYDNEMGNYGHMLGELTMMVSEA